MSESIGIDCIHTNLKKILNLFGILILSNTILINYRKLQLIRKQFENDFVETVSNVWINLVYIGKNYGKFKYLRRTVRINDIQNISDI